MSVYKVTGVFDYRGHPPGSLFEAELDAEAEGRALRFGSITVVDRRRTELVPGSYRLPTRWRQRQKAQAIKAAPAGAVSTKGAK